MRLPRHLPLSFLIVVALFAAVVWQYNRFVHYEHRVVAQAPPDVPSVQAPEPWRDRPVIRVLSLDGGGIRGLLTLEVLGYMTSVAGRPIAELFDVIAGSSTGAIIGTQLILADVDGAPKHTTASLIDEYSELARRVFSAPWYHRFLTLGGLAGPKYRGATKLELTAEVYGDRTFGELLRPSMVLAYSMTRSRLVVFRNWSAKDADLELSALVSAASNPPVFFPALTLESEDPTLAGDYIDGSVLGNNPSAIVFSELLDKAPDAEFVVVSIGTGRLLKPMTGRWLTQGGMITWALPLLTIMAQGQGPVASELMQELAEARHPKLRFYRFEAEVPPGVGRLDDASPEHVAALRELGRGLVREEQKRLDELVEILKGAGEP